MEALRVGIDEKVTVVSPLLANLMAILGITEVGMFTKQWSRRDLSKATRPNPSLHSPVSVVLKLSEAPRVIDWNLR